METTLLHSTIHVASFPSPTRSIRLKRVNSLKPTLSFTHPVIRFNFKPLNYRPVNCLSHPHINHQHHHHDHHHHHCHNDCSQLSGPQKAVIKFAKATRWLDLANFLREHLQLCCCAAALFLAAAACPYLLPKPAIKPLQNAFLAVAFPLVGVSIIIIIIIHMFLEIGT